MKESECRVEMDWFGDRAFMRIEKAVEKGIEAIALEVEAQTKVNIHKPFEHADGSYRGQIDTGAMVNSVRAEFGKIPAAPKDTVAAVNVSTEYAAYQESLRPFLWPAVEDVREKAPGIVRAVASREVGP